MPTEVGNRKRYTKEEELEILHSLTKYKTLTGTASALGVSFNTVQRCRKKYGLFERAKKKKQKQQQNLLEQSIQYKNTHEAARKMSVNEEVLRRLQKQAGVYSPRKRHCETERNKYVEESLKYETILEAAKAFDIRYKTLLRWRAGNGIRSTYVPTTLHNPKYTEEQRLYFAQESMKYENLSKASDSLGVSFGSLKAWCKKFGVPIKKTHKTYSPEEKQEHVERMTKGTSVLCLAREKNISYTALYRWKKAAKKNK